MSDEGKASFSKQYMDEVGEVARKVDPETIEKAVALLAETRNQGGRLFILGVGGSAANASHAVNDFRKITGIEAYTPIDNVAELTARTNDHGWVNVFEPWLKTSRLNSKDAVLVLSVGGGDEARQISANIVSALKYARSVGSKIIGVVGRKEGYTAKVADACVIIPTVNPEHVTAHAESFQAVIWHLFVFHDLLKAAHGTWESVGAKPEPSADK